MFQGYIAATELEEVCLNGNGKMCLKRMSTALLIIRTYFEAKRVIVILNPRAWLVREMDSDLKIWLHCAAKLHSTKPEEVLLNVNGKNVLKKGVYSITDRSRIF